MDSASPPASPAAAPHDLSAFLTDLGMALQTHGAYPPGHPVAARASAALVARLHALLAERATVSLGIARRQLVVEGVATPAENPLLASVAERLHRQRVGALSFARGAGEAEVDALLRILTPDPLAADDGRAALAAFAADGSAPHLRLHALSYGDLEMQDGGDGDAGSPRAAQLWLGLARAALQRDVADDAPPPDPGEVARAIDARAGAEAFEQTVVGYLLELADELRAEGASERARDRASALMRRLRPETLRRLLAMGGDTRQRLRFLLDATRGFDAQAVVRLAEAAAGAGGQTVSDSLLRLLGKLATHAGDGDGVRSASADAALREEVERLVTGWMLPDPNPEAYTRMLEGMARLPAAAASAPGWGGDAEPDRIVMTALETEAGGPAVWMAVERMLAADRVPALLRLLAGAPDGSAVAGEAWARVTTPATLRRLASARQPDAHAIAVVCDRMGAAAVPVLLEVMADADARAVRRSAFDRLAALGPAVATEAAARLDDGRWYVRRNLLALLAEVGVPAGFTAAPYLRDGDVRVRREAAKVAFRLPAERTRAVCLSLAEADPPLVNAALAECAASCPPEAVPLVCRAATDGLEEPTRVAALALLGAIRDPIALATLLRYTEAPGGWLRRKRLPPRSPELLAALASLATGWAAHPAAAEALALAAASTDAAVRAAAGRAP